MRSPLSYLSAWESDGVRLMLDTNVWSYLSDAYAVAQLEKLLRQRRIELVLPPSVLVEVLRLSRTDVRHRIVAALTQARARRTRTEADLESEEFVSCVRSYRPGWMRQVPDRATERRLRELWSHRIWRQAATDSTRLHEYAVADDRADRIGAIQKWNRAEFVRAQVASVDLVGSVGNFGQGGGPPGWDGQPLAAWRALIHPMFWHQLATMPQHALLSRADTTYADWVGCWVSLSTLRRQPESFGRLWFEDIQLTDVRRSWLRWAVESVQTTMKVTPGNAVDAQHSSYLLDGDLFLTADKRYFDAIVEVRRQAPFEFAEPRLLSTDPSVTLLERIQAALR